MIGIHFLSITFLLRLFIQHTKGSHDKLRVTGNKRKCHLIYNK
ncbi:hypothetical protein NARC_80034 [Candidatus Nitrosocosmicus arcticus]|uniref:Uncharacterized protein n=1 Tax=Candidatus Nitrosocosmicus arcticus TaxID=2035267 RepID=A0A557SUN1_9ARCH|nr:hypothetical protein NARC_80034 [Candidatus Nitrosocosmicus arcticus]